MNFIDHLIFTTNTPNVRRTYPPILSDYIADPVILLGVAQSQGHPGSDENPPLQPATLPILASILDSYPRAVYDNFIFYRDTFVIDKAIQKHWYDMVSGPISPIVATPIFQPQDAPPYHFMYAYLLENTKIYQIFERLIYLYLNGEDLGVASSNNLEHQRAFQWILNTESLFFKHLSNNNFRNITSSLRSNEENVRRNAYYRLFGMDLAFDHSNNSSYNKSKMANNDFILLFELFLQEVWQAYINARNSSGANSTDYQKLVDMVTKLREMLLARRGARGTIRLDQYGYMNLSREEYSSVGLFNWLSYIISYDSPVVTFLGCQANTSSERLMKIGRRVQIEPHAKSQALMDLSIPTATILRMIEFGTLEVNSWLQDSIESQTPLAVFTAQQASALVDLLTIINNWEKATGHNIKNPGTNIRGSVTLRQNGVNIATNGMMPKPTMN